MANKIWYTARATFDPEHGAEFSWDKYIKWSNLTHLTELVSLDGILNGLVFEPDYNSKEDWKYIVTEELIELFGVYFWRKAIKESL